MLALWWRGNCLCGVLEVLLTLWPMRSRAVRGRRSAGRIARAWASLARADGGCCAALADLRIIACDPLLLARS